VRNRMDAAFRAMTTGDVARERVAERKGVRR